MVNTPVSSASADQSNVIFILFLSKLFSAKVFSRLPKVFRIARRRTLPACFSFRRATLDRRWSRTFPRWFLYRSCYNATWFKNSTRGCVFTWHVAIIMLAGRCCIVSLLDKDSPFMWLLNVCHSTGRIHIWRILCTSSFLRHTFRISFSLCLSELYNTLITSSSLIVVFQPERYWYLSRLYYRNAVILSDFNLCFFQA